MPIIDFDNVGDPEDYSGVPAGKYLCRLDSVDVKPSNDGDGMWTMWWKILGGEFTGRRIRDTLHFTDASLKRAKLFCSRMGVEPIGKMDLQPSMFIGREVYVTATAKEFDDKDGNKRMGNDVPFAGYEAVPKTKAFRGGEPIEAVASEDDDIPF